MCDPKVIGSEEYVFSINCLLEILNYIQHSANHVAHHQNKNYGSYQTQKFVYNLEIVFMKVHSPFKIHRILIELRTRSKLACLIQVILLVVGHGVVSQEERKNGGEMMWLNLPWRQKDDSGKSGWKVDIKKNISNQKGMEGGGGGGFVMGGMGNF